MKQLLLFILVLFLLKPRLQCQKLTRDFFFCAFTEDSGSLRQCKLQQQNSFVKDEQAEKAVDMILSPLGLKRNFILVSCPNIRNAVAIVPNDSLRYIIYDDSFMRRINQAAATDWASISILAHEIGHHLNGHTLKPTVNLAEQRKRELEADEFSGFVLFRLHASLSKATAAMNQFKDTGDDSHSSHPNSRNRLKAIEKGYNQAKNQQPLELAFDDPLSPNKLFTRGMIYITNRNTRKRLKSLQLPSGLTPTSLGPTTVVAIQGVY